MAKAWVVMGETWHNENRAIETWPVVVTTSQGRANDIVKSLQLETDELGASLKFSNPEARVEELRRRFIGYSIHDPGEGGYSWWCQQIEAEL